jgi:hypothetical protein
MVLPDRSAWMDDGAQPAPGPIQQIVAPVKNATPELAIGRPKPLKICSSDRDTRAVANELRRLYTPEHQVDDVLAN